MVKLAFHCINTLHLLDNLLYPLQFCDELSITQSAYSVKNNITILHKNSPLYSNLFVGRSLIWVSVLGAVVMYQFALAAFAYLRYTMDVQRPDASLFCGTLFQCTATIMRYGLVGEIFEVLISQ